MSEAISDVQHAKQWLKNDLIANKKRAPCCDDVIVCRRDLVVVLAELDQLREDVRRLTMENHNISYMYNDFSEIARIAAEWEGGDEER